MIINNPTILAGYTRNLPHPSNKLATVGQVSNAVNSLNQMFTELLTGTSGNGSVNAGIGGISKKCGYAWLNEQGFIDESLMPSISVIDSYRFSQKEVKEFLNVVKSEDDIKLNYDNAEFVISKFLKSKIDDSSIQFVLQKGDIIIIDTDDKINDSHNNEDMIADPLYAGAYVVNKVPSAPFVNGNTGDVIKNSVNGGIELHRIAYFDSNIISVNGRYPKNTDGVLNVNVKDVLSTEIPESVKNDSLKDEEKTQETLTALSENIYKITAVNDGDSTRFAFFDGKGIPIAYAKKSEVDEIKTVNYSMTASIAAVNEMLGKKEAYESTYDVNAPVYQQLNQLRKDVDANAKALEQLHADLVAYMKNVTASVNALIGALHISNDRLSEFNPPIATNKTPEQQNPVEPNDSSNTVNPSEQSELPKQSETK